MVVDNIIIKDLEKSKFYQASQLVIDGLLEHGNGVFKYTTLQSANVQVSQLFVFFVLLALGSSVQDGHFIGK